jgi:tRNA (adenine37-N6)-methyltransferase
MNSFTVTPIGIVHSPFKDKSSAPRQPSVVRDAAGSIELFPDPRFEYGLADLGGWSHIWVLFWFHLNDGWRSMVRPPRSSKKRGVFATRSPHRPNPIGLSVVRLESIRGRSLDVRGIDIIDGSPVLDIKPYLPYSDAITTADSGWLSEAEQTPTDDGPRYEVTWTPEAVARLDWLEECHGVKLRADAERTLALGPTPHPYRRIKRDGDGYKLALRDFRLLFLLDGQKVTVFDVSSGYRPRYLADPSAIAKAETPLSVHRAFVEKFG